MKEYLEDFLDDGILQKFNPNNDPFWDPLPERLIGIAKVPMAPMKRCQCAQGFNIDIMLQGADPKAAPAPNGKFSAQAFLSDEQGKALTGVEKIAGRDDIYITVDVMNAQNIPGGLMDSYVMYRFAWEQDITMTKKDPRPNNRNVTWQEKSIHKVPKISEEQEKTFFNGFIYFSVFSHPVSKRSTMGKDNSASAQDSACCTVF